MSLIDKDVGDQQQRDLANWGQGSNERLWYSMPLCSHEEFALTHWQSPQFLATLGMGIRSLMS